MKLLNELVEYLHDNKPHEVKSYIMEQITKTVDNNKGAFWEDVLAKAMVSHTVLLGRNTHGRDFTDNTDAKFATYYLRKDRIWEASVSNIRTKIGPLRICLCVPGIKFHKVYFLFIPHEAYQPYCIGSEALKFGLSPTGKPTGKLSRFLCSWDKVIQPYHQDALI